MTFIYVQSDRRIKTNIREAKNTWMENSVEISYMILLISIKKWKTLKTVFILLIISYPYHSWYSIVLLWFVPILEFQFPLLQYFHDINISLVRFSASFVKFLFKICFCAFIPVEISKRHSRRIHNFAFEADQRSSYT